MASERISIICSNYSLAERRALTQYPGQQRLDMYSIGLELQVLHQILDRSSFLMVRHNRDVPAILIDQSQQYLADIRIHPPSPLYISDTVYPFPGRGKPSFALSPNSSLLQIPYKISSLICHLSSILSLPGESNSRSRTIVAALPSGVSPPSRSLTDPMIHARSVTLCV